MLLRRKPVISDGYKGSTPTMMTYADANSVAQVTSEDKPERTTSAVYRPRKKPQLSSCGKFRLRMRESEEEPPLHESQVRGLLFSSPPRGEGAFAVPSWPATSGVDHPRRWGRLRSANGGACPATGTGTSDPTGPAPRSGDMRGSGLPGRQATAALPMTKPCTWTCCLPQAELVRY